MGVRHLVLLAAVAAGVAACDAPTYPAETFGYDPRLTFDTSTGVARFPIGSTITLYADTTGTPEGYDLRAALAQAMARWQAVPRYGEFTLAQTTDLRRADVIVRFRSTPSIVDLSTCDAAGGGLGRTYFCPDSTSEDGGGLAPVLPFLDGIGSRVKAEVYVDPLGVADVILQQVRQTRQEYFVTLLTHELGHVLGIGAHSSGDRDIMNGFPKVRTPSAADERTLRWVWTQPAKLTL